MIALNIIYTAEKEHERVAHTLPKLLFYREHRYRTLLPHGIDAGATNADIENAVRKEWDENAYRTAKESIEALWPDIAREFNQAAQKGGFLVQPEYNVVLTRYGVGGSYNLPDAVVLNIRSGDGESKQPEQLARTLMHEMTHLIIEPLAQKYRLGHEAKEAVVEKLLSVLLPRFTRRDKKMSAIIDRVDALFHANYPDMKKIVQSLA